MTETEQVLECDNFENEECLCHKEGDCINLRRKGEDKRRRIAS